MKIVNIRIYKPLIISAGLYALGNLVFCIMGRIQVRPCFFNSGLRRLFEPKREATAGGWGNTIAKSFVPGDLHHLTKIMVR